MLVDSIYKLGYKPKDVKMILISHAHLDHFGGAAIMHELTGETYTIAMHGGVGANTMNDDYYSTSQYLTPDLRQRLLNDAEKLKKIHVDIALPSHPNQIEILDRAGTYTHESKPYVDDTVWADFIDERVRQVKALMK